MPTNFFDFHLHPLFKKYISHFEPHYPTQRSIVDLSGDIHLNNDIMEFLDGKVLHFIDSQSSINQVEHLVPPAGEAKPNLLGVANVVAVEYGFTRANNLVGIILRGGLSSPLDKQYFNKVGNKEISYFQLIVKELDLYSRLANNGDIVLLSRKNKTVDLDNITKPTFAIAIEGGHSLNRTKVGLPAQATSLDTPQMTTHGLSNVYDDFIDNKATLLSPEESLKHLFAAMWQDGSDIFYLTLTHLSFISELQLATHAYGMKLLKHPYFYPAGSGLYDAGRRVIDAAYNMQADGKKTPVLIDIKHMSLKSRLDFYDYRREKGYNLPIIATHMAVTGYSIKNWVKALSDFDDSYETDTVDNPQIVELEIKPKLAAVDGKDPFKAVHYNFNPWSINLFNEDIVEILNSGGIIGLILDARVLGLKATTTNSRQYDVTQYMPGPEYEFIFDQGAPGVKDESPTQPAKEPHTSTNFNFGLDYTLKKDENPDMGMVSLALNIMHILAVGFSKTDKDPWKHIVIGSDYDGLIEPLPQIFNCTTISIIEKKLFDLMPKMESSYIFHNPTDDGMGVLPDNGHGGIDLADLKKRIRGIMFENGKKFLGKWYNGAL